jgi:gluconolactonase
MRKNPVWMGKEAVLPYEQGSVFFDGVFSDPQLNHPEGLAIDSEGCIWCGGERGEIFKLASDGSKIEQVATTNGFTLGLALDHAGFLYSCDLKHQAVFRLHIHSGQLERFADGEDNGRKIRIPDALVVDAEQQFLYVSDSYDNAEAGPGIWRFDLKNGSGSLWYDRPLRFANGIVMSPLKDALYVAETFAKRISKIPIRADGSPGEAEELVQVDALPDGLALDTQGRLYISCYEPSLLYRWSEASGLELLYYDPEAHMLCHPTNCAFRGNDLFTSNLGRWHITKIADVL